MQTQERFSARLEQLDGYQHLRWTQDGRFLWAVPDDQNSIRFWNTADGQVARTVEISRTDHERVEPATAVSPDGSKLIIVHRDRKGHVRSWSGDVTRPDYEFRLPGTPSLRLAISPDGLQIATDRSGNIDMVQVWDVRTGKLQFSRKTEVDTALETLRFTFSPSGRYLLLPRHVWDLQGPKLVWSDSTPDRFVATSNRNDSRGTAWTGDDKHIVVAKNGQYTLWNWPENRKLVTFAFLPNSNWFAFNHQNGHWTGSANLHRYVQFRQEASSTVSDRWYFPSEFDETFKRTNDPQRVAVRIPSSDK